MLETYKAGCKVNLDLKIIGIREDGYHLIHSLFWPLNNPCDTLTFEAKPAQNHLSMSCNIKDIDCNANTLTKAYAAFKQYGGICMGVHVHLEKNIPHGAGLGGGSSDAACVLKWCNKHASKPLSAINLQRVALQVGADVPFFLQNSPAQVEGIGEVLKEQENFLKNKGILLICPHIHISTPWAFKTWDKEQKKFFLHQDLTNFSHKDKHIFSYAANCMHDFGNDFEEVIFKHYPSLSKIKQNLQNAGAELAIMSGSGSSILGIFSNYTKACQVAQTMQHEEHRLFITTL